MKKLLTSTAVVFAVLVSGAAYAAPTCHQKVTLSQQDYFAAVFKLGQSVSKMVKPQALDLISSAADERDEKVAAYLGAVAAMIAKTLKTTVTDDIRDLTSEVSDHLIKDYDNDDKYIKDAVSKNNVKVSQLDLAMRTVITGFFACK